MARATRALVASSAASRPSGWRRKPVPARRRPRSPAQALREEWRHRMRRVPSTVTRRPTSVRPARAYRAANAAIPARRRSTSRASRVQPREARCIRKAASPCEDQKSGASRSVHSSCTMATAFRTPRCAGIENEMRAGAEPQRTARLQQFGRNGGSRDQRPPGRAAGITGSVGRRQAKTLAHARAADRRRRSAQRRRGPRPREPDAVDAGAQPSMLQTEPNFDARIARGRVGQRGQEIGAMGDKIGRAPSAFRIRRRAGWRSRSHCARNGCRRLAARSQRSFSLSRAPSWRADASRWGPAAGRRRIRPAPARVRGRWRNVRPAPGRAAERPPTPAPATMIGRSGTSVAFRSGGRTVLAFRRSAWPCRDASKR